MNGASWHNRPMPGGIVTHGTDGQVSYEIAVAYCSMATDPDALKGVRLDAVSNMLRSADRLHEDPMAWRRAYADILALLVAVIDDGTEPDARRYQAAECLVHGAERGWWRVPSRFL